MTLKEQNEFYMRLGKLEKQLKEIQAESFHLKILCNIIGESEFDPTFQMIISDIGDGLRALEECRKGE